MRQRDLQLGSMLIVAVPLQEKGFGPSHVLGGVKVGHTPRRNVASLTLK
jgi:hypothetical protein